MKVTINSRFIHMTGEVSTARYSNGTTALVIEDPDDLHPFRLSVNLQEYGLVPAEGFVYVPLGSEHEGLLEELLREGVVVTPDGGEPVPVGYGPFDSAAALVKVAM